MGDPAGIGGELTLKAWRQLRGTGPEFAALDDPERLSALDPGIPIRTVDSAEQARAVFADALPVLATPLAGPARPGHPDPGNAGAVLRSIENAVALARARLVLGIV